MRGTVARALRQVATQVYVKSKKESRMIGILRTNTRTGAHTTQMVWDGYRRIYQDLKRDWYSRKCLRSG